MTTLYCGATSKLINNEKDIINSARRALETVTGLTIGPRKSLGGKDQRVDFEIGLKKGNGIKVEKKGRNSTQSFFLEVKKKITPATISDVMSKSQKAAKKIVLVSQYIPSPQAEKLRSLDIPFFDAAGNAYFNEPGFFVFVTGRKAEVTKHEKAIRLFNKSGIKLLFAFLNEPELIEKDYRTIMEKTGIASTSTVSDLIADLERRGYITKIGKSGFGKRRLRKKSELFKRWVEAYTDVLRPKLVKGQFVSKRRSDAWWKEVDITAYDACWGGEMAAARLTNYLRPEIVTIYADSSLPKLQAKYGLQRNPNGNVEILQRFWKQEGETEIAPPLIVYADLINSADERNIETAGIIYDRHIAGLIGDSAD
jgi:hypothetical protein